MFQHHISDNHRQKRHLPLKPTSNYRKVAVTKCSTMFEWCLCYFGNGSHYIAKILIQEIQKDSSDFFTTQCYFVQMSCFSSWHSIRSIAQVNQSASRFVFGGAWQGSPTSRWTPLTGVPMDMPCARTKTPWWAEVAIRQGHGSLCIVPPVRQWFSAARNWNRQEELKALRDVNIYESFNMF